MERSQENDKLAGIRKGGIESIIGVVLLVAIVIGLIIAAIIPMTQSVRDTGLEGKTKIDNLL